MPRKSAAEKSAEVEDDDGPAGAFLDSLPDGDEKNHPDDGGDDSGEGEPVDTAPEPTRRPRGNAGVTNVPRGVRGPRAMTPEQRQSSPALNRAREFQENAYVELDAMLADLNFSQRNYEIRVSRLSPETDENGVDCTGNLYVYKTKVSIEQIQQRFGGGVYEVKIWGPHPATGVNKILKTDTVKIAGLPKPMPTHKDVQRERQGSEVGEVLRAFAESNDKNQQRVADILDRQRDTPGALSELLPALTPLIERFLSKSEQSTASMIEAQREERRADEARRAEERSKEDERRREEREDRRREEDKRRDEERRAEDKRRDDDRRLEEARKEHAREERERLTQEREAERERAREERDRLREEMKQEAAEKQRQHERDLAAQSERTKQDAQRQQEFLSMMQNFQSTQMEMLTARQETGGIKAVTENLLMLKQLSNTLTGNDEEPNGFERFTENLQTAITSVMPVAQQVMAARAPRQQAQQQPQQGQPQQQQQQQRPILVDLGPKRTALPAQQPQQQPTQNPGTPPAAMPAAQTQESTMPAVETIVNDFKEFHFPDAGDDMKTAGQMLLKNVDLAVQRNMTAEQIVKQVLEPFETLSPMLATMATSLSGEQLVGFVEANVPSDWAILTPKGEELIVEAFDLWSGEEE